MTVGTVLYGLTSAWTSPQETAAGVGGKLLRLLKLFEPLDPSFNDWWSTDQDQTTGREGERQVSFAALEPRIASWVADHAWRDDWGGQDPELGYQLGAFNGLVADLPTSRSLEVILTAGSMFVNHSRIGIGSPYHPPAPDLVRYDLFRGALLALISVWPSPWANVKCSIWGEDPPTPTGEPPFPYSRFQMPWISYLCAERAAQLGPLPDLITERTPDGGLLMSATTERFDPTNLQHLRSSRHMASIMIEHAAEPAF
jgi:hypothetical protein